MLTTEYKTPVLFLIHKRPDLTQKVWEEIAAIKPSKIFIAADGPKNHRDKELCEDARRITENITWECKVKRLYRDKNLGCRQAVSEAISWFFSEVEEGVILEDDCLPNKSFFMFCKEMLEYFRYEESVGHISGSNHLKSTLKNGNASFFFSKYAHIWGWASWRRVWKNYKVNIDEIPILEFEYNSLFEKVYWWDKFRKTSSSEINTWDYQYLCMLWERKLNSIMPVQNLIINIGVDSRATHGSIFNYRIKRYIEREREELKQMIYPLNQQISKNVDKIIYRRLYNRFILSNILLVIKFYIFMVVRPLLKKIINAYATKIYLKIPVIFLRTVSILPGRGRYISFKNTD